jgi:GNAT superfamily N-acetyltransferase
MNDKTPPEEMPPIEIGLIGKDNIEFFSRFFPAELQKPVLNGEMSALGAAVDETACGAVVYQPDGTLVTLESLYVAPDYRRQHIASTLFCEMTDFFEIVGTQSVEVSFMDDGKNGLRPFFEKLGFELEDEETQTTVVAVADLPFTPLMEVKGDGGYTILPFSKLSPVHIRELDAALSRDGANLTGLPLGSDAFFRDISFACYKNNEPLGCVCFSGGGKGELILSVLYTAVPAAMPTAAALRAAAEVIIEKRPDDTVVIPLIQESAVKLARHLMGDKLTVRDKMVTGRFVL